MTLSDGLATIDDFGRRAVAQIAGFFSSPAFFVPGAIVLAILAVLPQSAPSRVPVLCPFRLATGHNCPGCGAVHGFSALAHGDFSQAFGLHPFLILLAFPAALAFPARLIHNGLRPAAATATGLAGLWLPRGAGLAFFMFCAAWIAWWAVGVVAS